MLLVSSNGQMTTEMESFEPTVSFYYYKSGVNNVVQKSKIFSIFLISALMTQPSIHTIKFLFHSWRQMLPTEIEVQTVHHKTPLLRANRSDTILILMRFANWGLLFMIDEKVYLI